MNILQKISYRIFQEAFHLVIPFLPYREPEILDSCTDLSKVFKKENKNLTHCPFCGTELKHSKE